MPLMLPRRRTSPRGAYEVPGFSPIEPSSCLEWSDAWGQAPSSEERAVSLRRLRKCPDDTDDAERFKLDLRDFGEDETHAMSQLISELLQADEAMPSCADLPQCLLASPPAVAKHRRCATTAAKPSAKVDVTAAGATVDIGGVVVAIDVAAVEGATCAEGGLAAACAKVDIDAVAAAVTVAAAGATCRPVDAAVVRANVDVDAVAAVVDVSVAGAMRTAVEAADARKEVGVSALAAAGTEADDAAAAGATCLEAHIADACEVGAVAATPRSGCHMPQPPQEPRRSGQGRPSPCAPAVGQLGGLAGAVAHALLRRRRVSRSSA